MKLLITGCKGQLGRQLLKILQQGRSQLGELPAAYADCEVAGIDLEDLDLSDLAAVKRTLEDCRPDVVINCAAYTKVDQCEIDQDAAYAANALAPRNLAMVCDGLGAKLVQVSTDYVFPGVGNVPYREYDRPGPVSVYGKTKLMGEEFVQRFCPRSFVVRTAWLYGDVGGNFVRAILKRAREEGKIRVVDDQRGNPTYAEDLAHHLLAIALTEEYGIYHCTGSGECSWYEFACAIVEEAGVPCEKEAITTSQLGRGANRPAYSSLEHMMLRLTVGDRMRPWREALRAFIASQEV